MATISLADIQMVSNDDPIAYVAAAAIAAGEVFYLDTNTQGVLADNSAASTSVIGGVALQDADVGNIVLTPPDGATIQVSNVLVVGDIYILATVAGDVMLSSDILTTQFLSVFGTVNTTSSIVLSFNNTGSVRA